MRNSHNWRRIHRAAIDALEPRRLLTVFTGTDNSDTIRITKVGSFTQALYDEATKQDLRGASVRFCCANFAKCCPRRSSFLSASI